MPRLGVTTFLTSLLFFLLLPGTHAQKPPLTLDEFFNAVYFQSVQISPDGHAVVVETLRADWSASRFSNDVWLYRDDTGGSLVQLTQSGHDSSPQRSPDGHWGPRYGLGHYFGLRGCWRKNVHIRRDASTLLLVGPANHSGIDLPPNH